MVLRQRGKQTRYLAEHQWTKKTHSIPINYIEQVGADSLQSKHPQRHKRAQPGSPGGNEWYKQGYGQEECRAAEQRTAHGMGCLGCNSFNRMPFQVAKNVQGEQRGEHPVGNGAAIVAAQHREHGQHEDELQEQHTHYPRCLRRARKPVCSYFNAVDVGDHVERCHKQPYKQGENGIVLCGQCPDGSAMEKVQAQVESHRCHGLPCKCPHTIANIAGCVLVVVQPVGIVPESIVPRLPYGICRSLVPFEKADQRHRYEGWQERYGQRAKNLMPLFFLLSHDNAAIDHHNGETKEECGLMRKNYHRGQQGKWKEV